MKKRLLLLLIMVVTTFLMAIPSFANTENPEQKQLLADLEAEKQAFIKNSTQTQQEDEPATAFSDEDWELQAKLERAEQEEAKKNEQDVIAYERLRNYLGDSFTTTELITDMQEDFEVMNDMLDCIEYGIVTDEDYQIFKNYLVRRYYWMDCQNLELTKRLEQHFDVETWGP